MADHQGAEALIRAAEVLEREARGLFDCHTSRGRWAGDYADAKADHDEMLALAGMLRAWNRRPAPAAEPAAWISDDGRAISHEQKARAERDGGASASSVKPYQHPCYRADHLADANKMVAAGWDGLPEPSGVIIVGTQALRAFTADQMRQAIRDALAAAKVPQWLPIEQAPRDGTNVLLVNFKGNIASGLWQGRPGIDEGWWLRGGSEPDVFFNSNHGPSFWMPQPARPSEEEQNQATRRYIATARALSDKAAPGGGEEKAC